MVSVNMFKLVIESSFALDKRQLIDVNIQIEKIHLFSISFRSFFIKGLKIDINT